MSDGWVSIHRSIQDHWLWKDEPYDKARAWIDLLLLANHEDTKVSYKGEIIVCARGTVNRSIKSLAERWCWSRDKATRFLKLLESDGMCVINATTNRTTITIVNYGKYQDDNAPNKATSKATSKQRTKQRADTNNNDNNVNNDNKKDMYGEFHHVLLTKEEYVKLGVDYGIEKRAALIKFFDEYLENNPKYKKPNHNLCIRNWVVNAVAEKEEKDAKYRVNQNTTYRGFDCNAQ